MARPDSAGAHWAAFWSAVVLIGLTVGLLVATVNLRAHWHDPIFIGAAAATGIGAIALFWLAVRATRRVMADHRLIALIWEGEHLRLRLTPIQTSNPKNWVGLVECAERLRDWDKRLQWLIRGRFPKAHFDRYTSRHRGGPYPSPDAFLEVWNELSEELNMRLRTLEEFRGDYVSA